MIKESTVHRENKRVVITPHQGFADFFNQKAILDFYIKRYDFVIIIVSDVSRMTLLKALFKKNSNVLIKIPKFNKFTNIFSKTKATCIICHTSSHGIICGRRFISPCIYVNYSDFTDYLNIKIGAFSNFTYWEAFRYKKENISFAHAFYLYAGFNVDLRILNFKITRDYSLEKLFFAKFIKLEKYILVHQDLQRGLVIGDALRKVSKCSSKVINIDKLSEHMIDTIGAFELADEIHLIDSSYSVLIYLLSFHNKKIMQIPKYLHLLNRAERDVNIYKNPIAPNWHFCE